MSNKIKCKNCGHTEDFNLSLVAKIIGAGTVGFGAWAWVAYLFAGTGLALPICAAIVAGGVGVLAFAGEIAEWLGKVYPCPNCGRRSWRLIRV